MPTVSKKELIELIADGHILLFTIDTNVLVRHNYRLNSNPLKSFEQFNDSRFGFVLSEIVLKETMEKLSDEIRKTKSEALKNAKSLVGLVDNKTVDAKKLIEEIVSKSENLVATEQLQDFLDRSGCALIKNEKNGEIQEVFESYFRAKPPFSDKKKSEFPDAFALSALDYHAHKTKAAILVFSADNDWQRFCEVSANLYHSTELTDVEEALALFSRPDDGFLKFFHEKHRDAENPFFQQIRDAAEISLREDDPTFEADTNYIGRAEVECFGTSIDQLNLISVDITQVAVEHDEFTASFEIEADVSYDLSISHYVWDSIDKEEILLNSEFSDYAALLSFRISATIQKSDTSFKIIQVEETYLGSTHYIGPLDAF